MSDATSGPGCPASSYDIHKEKRKTLDLPNGSKNRISNSTFSGIKTMTSSRTAIRDPVGHRSEFLRDFAQDGHGGEAAAAAAEPADAADKGDNEKDAR